MDAYAVSRLIEDIAETSSRIEKEKLVSDLVGSDLGKFVVQWAYDPMITFGIKPALTESTGKFNVPFTEKTVAPLLKSLASRELTGNAAEAEIAEVMQAFDKDGARLLFLILSKDLKCGIAESTINGVLPGLVPVFAVMRAHPYDPKKVKSWPRKGEYKLDGNRNTFLARDGQGGFFTRTGKIVPSLDFLVKPVLDAAKKMLAGDVTPELRATLIDAEGHLSFMLDGEAMMGLFGDAGKLRRKGSDADGAELHLYDILSYANFDEAAPVGPTLDERRKVLREFVHLAHLALAGTPHAETIQIVPQFFVNNDDEVQKLFQQARNKTLASYLARGNAEREAELLKTTIDAATGQPKVLEGAMIKDPDALYEKRKSNSWLKVKAEETEDIRITGAYAGNEHTELEHTLGGLQFTRPWDNERGEMRVDVGGGYSREQRDELWALWQEDLAHGELAETRVNGKVWFDYVPMPGYVPKLARRLGEIEFHEVTPDGSLRHPRFVRFRDDKDGEIEDKEAA